MSFPNTSLHVHCLQNVDYGIGAMGQLPKVNTGPNKTDDGVFDLAWEIEGMLSDAREQLEKIQKNINALTDLKIIGVLKRKGANLMGKDQDDIPLAPWPWWSRPAWASYSGSSRRGRLPDWIPSRRCVMSKVPPCPTIILSRDSIVKKAVYSRHCWKIVVDSTRRPVYYKSR